MKTLITLLAAGLVLPLAAIAETRPNILFITLDDMGWDSIGCYGSKVPEISPHIDSLAEKGMRFENAYVQTSSCVPSRNVFTNGRYPQTSGVRGFFSVQLDYPILPELLRQNGYLTGIIYKGRDSSPNDQYARYWDTDIILKNSGSRTPSRYAGPTDTFLKEVKEAGKPFYLNVNVADPHQPFYNGPKTLKEDAPFDRHEPSRVYTAEEVEIPGFLPDHPRIRRVMANYYSSVKRGDDCVGAVLAMLQRHELEEETVIIFVSDHGMPMPYAKSSLYTQGVKTPWIVVWPGETEPAHVDSRHFVSAVDFMPTILDIAGIEKPDGLQGRSILQLVCGGEQDDREMVVTTFDENANGYARPMRAIHDTSSTYIFNAWATGETKFVCEANWYGSYGVMGKLAEQDDTARQRFEHLNHRTVEELYDRQRDPDSLINLVDDPAYATVVAAYREKLENWMRETGDYALRAFLVKDDLAGLAAFMAEEEAAALERAQTIQWKRYKNRAGGTGKRSKLFKVE